MSISSSYTVPRLGDQVSSNSSFQTVTTPPRRVDHRLKFRFNYGCVLIFRQLSKTQVYCGRPISLPKVFCKFQSLGNLHFYKLKRHHRRELYSICFVSFFPFSLFLFCTGLTLTQYTTFKMVVIFLLRRVFLYSRFLCFISIASLKIRFFSFRIRSSKGILNSYTTTELVFFFFRSLITGVFFVADILSHHWHECCVSSIF